MELKHPQLGVKMNRQQAKAYVDHLNTKAQERWEEKVSGGNFMTSLMKGTLPLPAIRLFFKNWGAFTVEINTLIAATYLYSYYPEKKKSIAPSQQLSSCRRLCYQSAVPRESVKSGQLSALLPPSGWSADC